MHTNPSKVNFYCRGCRPKNRNLFPNTVPCLDGRGCTASASTVAQTHNGHQYVAVVRLVGAIYVIHVQASSSCSDNGVANAHVCIQHVDAAVLLGCIRLDDGYIRLDAAVHVCNGFGEWGVVVTVSQQRLASTDRLPPLSCASMRR